MERKNRHTAILEEVSWAEARPAFLKVKPALAELIDERKPNKQYPLIRVRYPYGAIILQNGILHLPNKHGEVVPITHSSIDKSIADKLSYSSFPLGLMTHNGIEVSRETTEGRIFTLRFFQPGVIMGLWESLVPSKSHFPTKIWTVTAGARFIFTLPKIQAAAHYNRLKKEFDLPNKIPNGISEQWHMFKHLANHPNFTHEWYQEIYYFPKNWLEEDRHNIDWVMLHHFLLEQAWQLSEYTRNTRNQDVIWDLFANMLSAKSRRPNPYHIEILKYMVAMALGDIPGVRAAGKLEVAAPTRGFQEVLIHGYHLRQYVPTIMHPYAFSLDDPEGAPVYCSYQVPNLLVSVPTFKTPTSTLSELLLVYELMDEFLHAAFAGHLKLENTLIVEVLKQIKFDFFHSDVAGSYKSKISHTREMPKGDPGLIELDPRHGKRQFSESSHFIRGCIRVSKK